VVASYLLEIGLAKTRGRTQLGSFNNPKKLNFRLKHKW